MWRIEEHHRVVDKQIDAIPTDILKRYEKWKDIAVISGPTRLWLIKGFHDEALVGKWEGYRSSRLGLAVPGDLSSRAGRAVIPGRFNYCSRLSEVLDETV